jgi:glycosyltransferase involved in cell wall biosynthesis
LLCSIQNQTRLPDEVIVVDGGSHDGTLNALRRWQERLPLQVIAAPGANISRGRNLAISAATGEWVAVTDAGVHLDAHWLERLCAASAANVEVVSGFFRADPHTMFERALGATTLPAVEDVKPELFLPSSRSVMFRKTAWERVGGYPEWLDYCEDLVFDLALKRARCRFVFAPDAIAWFRPRRSVAAFFNQYYLYARGDGKAGLWPKRHAIRYLTYLLAMLVLLRRSGLVWLLPLGAAAYSRRPVERLEIASLPATERASVLVLVPMIRFFGDMAKMLGYPVGVWWRLRRTWISRSSS